MKKVMCAKCGGQKMAKGGATNKPQIYGIPQTGTTNYSAPTMKKGGMVKKQNDGKTGAQLKAEGMAMKKKGQALKAKGQAMKAVGSIKPKTGMDGVNALAYHIKKGGVYKKGGSTFGMLSVKAGIDNNPGKTAADRIAGAKMKMRKKK